MNTEASKEDRQKLAGLLGFAEGVLRAREKVQVEMQAGLGVFHEHDFMDCPGVHFDNEDGTWLLIDRQRETAAPAPVDHVAEFLVSTPKDPEKLPKLRPTIAVEVSIEEASDLEESGLLKPDDIGSIVEDGIKVENRVKILLHAANLPEMRSDYERYVSGPWSDWADREKPVRRTIRLYNSLFSIHSAIHTSEGAPPELVWGIGIGRWKTAGQLVDMPIIEQLVDINLEDGGVIAVRPRDLSPTLSLKPYIEIDIDGSSTLQRELQERLSLFLKGNLEFTPFSATLWEPLLDTAASEISSSGLHVSREEMIDGERLPDASDQFRVTSSWAIFGRPRSNEARLNDLNSLRTQIDDDEAEVPASLKGYAITPPDEPSKSVDDFGLDTAILRGATQPTGHAGREDWVQPKATQGPGERHQAKEKTAQVHFFPLPFNHEQSRISDLIDDPMIAVACVSGPPGTGKSHSIANIISHQMALGKRVLVTARTPEAIAAVREKLPDSLRPLAIASVGTDRESAQQLQDAVKELSHEVVNLDIGHARARWEELDRLILECDEIAQKADEALATIARVNLDSLQWNGAQATPMEMVEILEREAKTYSWFTDRPEVLPPHQLNDTLDRLRTTLPSLAADIVYSGATLPEPATLPSTSDLIDAHNAELEWNNREIVDYSSAPRMARDHVGAVEQATRVLDEIESISRQIDEEAKGVRSIAIRALNPDGSIDRPGLESIRTYLFGFNRLSKIAEVRLDRRTCSDQEFMAAATRGASGQKPVGFGLFNGGLKTAIGSVRINGNAPAESGDWQIVLDACHLEKKHPQILDTLKPLIQHGVIHRPPQRAHELATFLLKTRSELEAALDIAECMTHVCAALKALFPFGLDIDTLKGSLDCDDAVFALRGNLPDGYAPHPALVQLKKLSQGEVLPVLVELGNLATALGAVETDPADIVTVRGEITQELGRLTEVSETLEAVGRDLQALSDAGAPDWRARLEARPDAAAELIPEGWPEAWFWAQMRGQVDRIIELGNGDNHRNLKAEATERRRRLFEELIRTRTMIGLKKRMTPSIRQAMETFTQAVSKIGTGKGKKAPRFIRAAREAAKGASSAAPVWIMPEYKIPEQLPADFGDFDLVILDEASQSDITALAALARGKKILVVGDEEQVSPSVVGISTQKINGLRAEFLDGLPGKDLIDENSSIFEITKRMHPESHVMLREHFRCVAPIIQFSTRYYNNELVPLRVPKASERFDPPLADVYIPGATRQGKTNAYEARWIVEEIARIIADPSHQGRDIGVISLIGSEQAEKIGRMLVEDERIGPEKIEERGIIYGDARTMQGQERSIVFLSMVATPGNAHSQTKKDDQQRINVAMSRAKDRLYLIRSVQLEDLKPSDIKAQILHHFVNPMPEGRTATGREIQTLLDRCDSGFEREVLQMLLDAGYRVRPQVAAGGFRIDLVVEGAEDRRLAIELDGDKFHGPDRWEHDMIRQAALERAGWVFWRVFGSQWLANKDYWWSDLLKTLNRLNIEPIGTTEIDDRFTETILVDTWSANEETSSLTSAKTVSRDEETSASTETSDPSGTKLPDPISPVEQGIEEGEIRAKSLEGASQATPSTSSELTSISETTPPAAENVVTEASIQREFDLVDSEPPTTNTPSQTTEATLHSVAGKRMIVSVGSTVRLEKLNGGGKIEITLVENGHDVDQGMIGVHTPLGNALLDAEVGEDVEYRAGPYIQSVRVMRIS